MATKRNRKNPRPVDAVELLRALATLPSSDLAQDLSAEKAKVADGIAALAEDVADLREALERALASLEIIGNHFDHDNEASAQDAVVKYFELWADDARSAITKAKAANERRASKEGRPTCDLCNDTGRVPVEDPSAFLVFADCSCGAVHG